jgi:Uma2 family endonuclease
VKSIPEPDYNAIYNDLERLPENVVGEIIDGELHAHPRPSPRHALAASAIGGMIGNRYHWGSASGGWWILDEPELRFGDNVVVPDIAGWRRQTMPELPESNQFKIRPDWVCEVLSASTVMLDRNRKLPLYVNEGVGHVWLVDPTLHVVEIYQPSISHTDPIMTIVGKVVLNAPPFEDTGIDLGQVFA